jgi:CheY-like chemotaxis protein
MNRSIDILLVEDDADIRSALASLLADAGRSVEAVGNGREALQVLRAGLRPRLVILDLMMPVMSGFEFRREQLADPALAAIPVIVISAALRSGEELSSMRAARAIAKPFDVADLLAAVDTAAAQGAPAGGAHADPAAA